MGMLSTFFLLSRRDMPRVLHGWKDPAPLLREPTARQFFNPFTGRTETCMSRINPLQPAADPDAFEEPDLYPGDQTFHWKSVTEHELAEIMVACGLSDSVDDAMELCAAERLNGPDDAYGMVHRVPQPLASALAKCTDARLSEIAASLVHLRGENAVPSWREEDVLLLLTGVHALAARAEYPDTAIFLHQGR